MQDKILILSRYGFSGPYVSQRVLESGKDLIGIVIESGQKNHAAKRTPKKNAMTLRQKIIAGGTYYLADAIFRKISGGRYELRHFTGWLLERLLKRPKKKDFFFFGELVRKHAVPVYNTGSLNSPEGIDLIKKLQPDIIVVCGTSVLKKEVLRCAKKAAINIHSSILPRYRGLMAEFWAVYHGDLEHLGVTIHFAEKTLDTGDIILQERVEFEPKDDFVSLRYKLVRAGAEKVVEVLTLFEQDRVKGVPQDAADASSFGRPSFEDIMKAKAMLKRLSGEHR